MAKCEHSWILMNASGTTTYVICDKCGTKFPFPHQSNGMRYTGFVPEKYAS